MTDRRDWIRLAVLVGLFFGYSCNTQAQARFWIEFRDKGIAAKDFVPGNPIFETSRESLTKECLLRRAAALHENLFATITTEDAPVCPRYLVSIRALGIAPIITYKWGNAVSARLTHAEVSCLKRLSFIRHIRPI
ncbi:MAG TPA: hypothetical protein VFD13_09250, partial [Candidatus Kapabacteria bacterium]|nr:hypothetical protein [Candidatus Kapabacteria bacterium]